MAKKPNDDFTERRKEHEQPAVIARCGWRYHHIGIPTDVARPGEEYLEQFNDSSRGSSRSGSGALLPAC